MTQQLIFTSSETGKRLDRFLADHSDLSRTHIQRLIEDGLVTVNDRAAKASARVTMGDVIHAELSPPPVPRVEAQAMPLAVLYEDDDVLVINKPSGLTVHPAPGHPDRTLVNALLAFRPELGSQSSSLRPGIVHRLDKDTSGVMVVAKHAAALQHLALQLKERRFTKRYLALVEGHLDSPRGLVDAPIGRDPGRRQRMAVVSDGREAYTRYSVVRTYIAHTLVEAELVTGRTHQIRVHFAAIGHAVVGDPVYGKTSPLVRRQFLHAQVLGFRLPSTNQPVEFTAPLPADLAGVLDRLSVAAVEDTKAAH